MPQRIKRIRVVCVVAMAFISASAFGNAAMGLAYEIFELDYWFVYVALTVILEAWMIGRAFGKTWVLSLGWSLGVNFLTAFCCSSGQLMAAHLHRMDNDPNPLLWTIELLTFFGLVSAFIEALIWRFRPLRFENAGKVWGRTFLAHILGVPLALVILLIPAHPYLGVEATVSVWRRLHLLGALSKVFVPRIDDKGHFKQFRDFHELERALDAQGGLGVCLYQPDYGRFSTHDGRTQPLSIELPKAKPDDSDPIVLTIHYGFSSDTWNLSDIDQEEGPNVTSP